MRVSVFQPRCPDAPPLSINLPQIQSDHRYPFPSVAFLNRWGTSAVQEGHREPWRLEPLFPGSTFGCSGGALFASQCSDVGDDIPALLLAERLRVARHRRAGNASDQRAVKIREGRPAANGGRPEVCRLRRLSPFVHQGRGGCSLAVTALAVACGAGREEQFPAAHGVRLRCAGILQPRGLAGQGNGGGVVLRPSWQCAGDAP